MGVKPSQRMNMKDEGGWGNKIPGTLVGSGLSPQVSRNNESSPPRSDPVQALPLHVKSVLA
eukprot:14942897-Alexandrium_andersonii.AAC.1